LTLLTTEAVRPKLAGVQWDHIRSRAAEAPTLRGFMAVKQLNPCKEGFHLCGEKEGGSVCLPKSQTCVICARGEKKCKDAKGKDYCIPEAKVCPTESLTLICPKGTKICRHTNDRHFCQRLDHPCPDLKAKEIAHLKKQLALYKKAAGPMGSPPMNITHLLSTIRDAIAKRRSVSAASPAGAQSSASDSAAVSQEMDVLTKNLQLVQAKVLDQNHVLKFLSSKLSLAEKQIYQKEHQIRLVRDLVRREREREDRENEEISRLRRRLVQEKRGERQEEQQLEKTKRKSEVLRREHEKKEIKEEARVERIRTQEERMAKKEKKEVVIKRRVKKSERKQRRVVRSEKKEEKADENLDKKEQVVVQTEGNSLMRLQGKVSAMEEDRHPSLPFLESS
jgi:hypothetical protein